MLTSAFTCTGPYAVLIMLGIKRVENRSMMPVPAKGRCAVGCSKSFCKEEYGNFVQWASRTLPTEDFERIPAWSDVKDWSGKVVGTCDYEARTRQASPSQGDLFTDAQQRILAGAEKNHLTTQPSNHLTISWDEGYEYWWDLSEVVCFDAPIPCRGNVGMWQMPRALAERVSAADEQFRAIGVKISSAEEAARLFRAAFPIVGDREGFFVLPLDGENRVLAAPMLVSLGHEVGTTAIDAGVIFHEALKMGAAEIIVAHNHPSGNLRPSKADIVATARLREAGELIGVSLIDHLILGAADSDGRPAFTSVN